MSVWYYYGKSIGALPLTICALLIAMSAVSFHSPSKFSPAYCTVLKWLIIMSIELWLKWNTDGRPLHLGMFIGIFVMLCLLTLFSQAAMKV